MKERSFVSVIVLGTSLSAYYLAKAYQKDTTPLVMMGGFLGAIIGEVIVEAHQQNNLKKNKRSIKKHKYLKK
jgi:uncharacterized membrane protein